MPGREYQRSKTLMLEDKCKPLTQEEKAAREQPAEARDQLAHRSWAGLSVPGEQGVALEPRDGDGEPGRRQS